MKTEREKEEREADREREDVNDARMRNNLISHVTIIIHMEEIIRLFD